MRTVHTPTLFGHTPYYLVIPLLYGIIHYPSGYTAYPFEIPLPLWTYLMTYSLGHTPYPLGHNPNLLDIPHTHYNNPLSAKR